MSWTIKPYSPLDKSFVIDGPLPLTIDNDEVPTDVVAILARRVARVLNEHFYAPSAWRCDNEDCERYGRHIEVRPFADTSECALCEDCSEPMSVQAVSL